MQNKSRKFQVSLYYCYHLYVAQRYEKDFTTVICCHPNYSQQFLNKYPPKKTVEVPNYYQFLVYCYKFSFRKASWLHQFLHSPTGCTFKIPLFGWGSSSTIRESTPKKKTLVVLDPVRLIPGPLQVCTTEL